MDMTDTYNRDTRDDATSKRERLAQHGAIAARNTEPLAWRLSPSAKFDLCRGSKAEHAKALVPLPASDPVFGPKGPLVAMWRT
jgi:hypothetical protein